MGKHDSNTKEEAAKEAFNQLGKGYYRWDYMCARKPEQEQWERAIEKQASVLIQMPWLGNKKKMQLLINQVVAFLFYPPCTTFAPPIF